MKQGITATFIILTVLCAGCSGRSAETAAPVEVSMENYTGRSVSDYYATGPYNLIVLNYWASFCAPCKKEMVDLSALYENYRDRGVLVLGAATDGADKKTLLEKIAASLGVTYPILYGAEAVFQGEEIIGYPTTFIIQDGRVVERIDGGRDYDFFAARVEHHLLTLTEQHSISGALSDEPRYFLTHGITAGTDGTVLTLELKPAEGYYLNGPGYPPLSVKIATADGFSVKPAEHTLDGVALGQSRELRFVLSGTPEQGTTVTISLSLIACNDNTCSMINEVVEIQL